MNDPIRPRPRHVRAAWRALRNRGGERREVMRDYVYAGVDRLVANADGDDIRALVDALLAALAAEDGLDDARTREIVWDLVPALTPTIEVRGEGMRFLVDAADDIVAKAAFILPDFELETMRAKLELVEAATGRASLLANRTFVDIGANVGMSTICAIQRFGAASAIAIEPAPSNAELLRCNVILNIAESRVILHRLALSDTTGYADLELSADNSGDNRVRVGDEGTPGEFDEDRRETVRVRTRRFDDLVVAGDIDLDSVGLVWSDVQGHEAYLLAGAESLLTSDVPVIIEYWPYGLRRNAGLDLLHELLAKHYTEVVDTRASIESGDAVRVPTHALAVLAAEYAGTLHTDLILVK